MASVLFFLSLRERTVASYFQLSLVRIYRVHRRSSGGSVLIVRVYIGRIFRLEILKFISHTRDWPLEEKKVISIVICQYRVKYTLLAVEKKKLKHPDRFLITVFADMLRLDFTIQFDLII